MRSALEGTSEQVTAATLQRSAERRDSVCSSLNKKEQDFVQIHILVGWSLLLGFVSQTSML